MKLNFVQEGGVGSIKEKVCEQWNMDRAETIHEPLINKRG